SSWTLPTASQEQQILATWGSVVPQPAFDYAYSWGVQNSDAALEDTPALQSVFASHNAGQAPASPPAAPSNLAASAASSSQVNLTWTDNAGNETGFKVERSASGSSFAQVALVGAGVTSYSDTGLAASTQYSYRVRATNGAGDSAYSNTASATTQAS